MIMACSLSWLVDINLCATRTSTIPFISQWSCRTFIFDNSKLVIPLTHRLSGLKTLSLVLFGIRSCLNNDLNCTAAELVHGTALCLPGQFFETNHTHTAFDAYHYVSQLCHTMPLCLYQQHITQPESSISGKSYPPALMSLSAGTHMQVTATTWWWTIWGFKQLPSFAVLLNSLRATNKSSHLTVSSQHTLAHNWCPPRLSPQFNFAYTSEVPVHAISQDIEFTSLTNLYHDNVRPRGRGNTGGVLWCTVYLCTSACVSESCHFTWSFTSITMHAQVWAVLV